MRRPSGDSCGKTSRKDEGASFCRSDSARPGPASPTRRENDVLPVGRPVEVADVGAGLGQPVRAGDFDHRRDREQLDGVATCDANRGERPSVGDSDGSAYPSAVRFSLLFNPDVPILRSSSMFSQIATAGVNSKEGIFTLR